MLLFVEALDDHDIKALLKDLLADASCTYPSDMQGSGAIPAVPCRQHGQNGCMLMQAALVAELQAGSTACRAACFTSHHGQEMVVGAYKDGCVRSFALPEGSLVATSAAMEQPLCGLVPSPHTPHILVLARSATSSESHLWLDSITDW